jgi:ABC-type uncharacterized transport system involved in gliding motility auxiliary subunit
MQELLNRWAGWAGLALLVIASMIYGVRGVADLGFWIPFALAVGCLGLYLSHHFDELKEAVSSRKTRMGANSVFLSVAALAIASLLLAIVNNHDVSWDLSKDKVHTLSDETRTVVKGLTQEVHVYAFFDPSGGQQARFEDLLRRVKAVNPAMFSYEFVNLNRNPQLAQQYSVRSYGTSVLVAGALDAPGGRNESINSAKEEDLVNALLKLSSTGIKTLYMVTGHGEASLEDSGPTGASELKKAFGNAAFDVVEINLATSGAIPADAAALILAGPKVDYPQPEVAVLRNWMAGGGRVIVALDPRTRVPNLTKFVDDSGIVLGNDIVVDPIMRLFGSDPIAPLASTFDPNHPITKDMRSGQQQLVFPLTQSVYLKDKLPAGVGGTVLATSNPTAWAYKGQGNRIPGKMGPGDQAGPIKLAAAVEGSGTVYGPAPVSATGKSFRLVVYGTSRLLTNDGIALYNNQDLTINSARWMADDEKRISIAAREEENQPLMLERSRMVLMWWMIILLPLATLGLGLLVILRRRRVA